MPTELSTYVYASDPISQAGVVSQLRMRPEIRVVEAEFLDDAEVAVVVADVLDEKTVRVLRALQRGAVRGPSWSRASSTTRRSWPPPRLGMSATGRG